MMGRLGVIGGIGPESTVAYYRAILAAARANTPSHPAPVLINSIDLSTVVRLVTKNALPALTEYLLREIDVLASGGASLGLLAANTPHIVFDEVRDHAPIPLVSIVEATCHEISARGWRRVGLLGTRFTMQGRFYPEVFERAGVALVTPDGDDQAFVHDAYMNELLNNVFLPGTRERLLGITDRLAASEGVEAMILAGTELPLILPDDRAPSGIPLVDTTQIHVKAAVRQLWGSG